MTAVPIPEPFPISLPAVSRHLKVLEQPGLNTRSRSAQWRSRSLRAGALREVLDWVGPYRDLWDERLDRLDAHLRNIQQGRDTGGEVAAERKA